MIVPPHAAPALLCAIVAISLLLMLGRPRGIAEAYWITGGSILLLLLRLISVPLAGRAVLQGSDVYLFLTGMMLLSALAREHGVFDWLSAAAVRRAQGSPARLFTLIYGAGILVTTFLSNDATAVVLTPAILSAVRAAEVDPLPGLFACALIANAASFVLPISNPANLVVFHDGMPPLGQWLAAFALPSALSIAVTYLVLRFLFRKQLRGSIDQQAERVPLRPEGKLVLAGLAATVAVLLTASMLHWSLGLPTCLAALALTAVLCLRQRANPLPLAREISWSTLVLVAGLFVMVRALESIGALRLAGSWLAKVQHLPAAPGALVTGFAVAVANNLVNNLPLGLLAGATLTAAHAAKGLLANAVLIGIDLGPNLSVTGSLATILWLLALRRQNLEVSFLRFLAVGSLAMPLALLAALGGTILMHLLVSRS